MLSFRAFLVAACALAAPALPQAPATPRPLPEDRAAGAAEITAAVIRPWLEELAGPACAGRGTGSAGFARAATLLRDHFASLGLEPGGDGGTFWQRVPWTQLAADPATTVLEVRKGEEIVCRLTPGDGLGGFAASSAEAEGELVLVKCGEDLEALSEAAVADKVVLVVAPATVPSDRIGRALRGSAAWLRVDERASDELPAIEGLARPGARAANAAVRGRNRTPNRLVTSSDRLAAILDACGQRGDAELSEGSALALSGLRARLHVDVVESEAPAYNVIGILRGSDPKLAEEFVVIGSHLDHLGTRGGNTYPGADDDASGSVGVMAIARAFAKNPQKPRRSILFVAFCGEELGLIGSDYFTKHPPIPLSRVAAELQMDMIGRREESEDEAASENANSLHLIGTEKLSEDLHALCIERNEAHAAFDLEWDEEGVFYRSDHYNFARHGVPIAFFFTGFHADYHRPSDTADKIDFDKLARVARYAYDIAFELADQDARPLIDPERWQKMRKDGRDRGPDEPAAPLRTAKPSRGQ
jgi:hypothetical protein